MDTFKIYRVYFGWNNISLSELDCIAETKHFWKISDGINGHRRISKNPKYDGSIFAKTIEESLNHLIERQTKKVEYAESKLIMEKSNYESLIYYKSKNFGIGHGDGAG